eukprot:1092889_1
MATHQTAMNLDRLVGCLNILNIDNDSSTIRAPYQQLLTDDKVNHESFIVSNADEELLILVEFTQIVSLRSMKVYYVPNVKGSDDMDVSGPKQIHVYLVKDLNKNFDDLEQLTPHKSKRCKEENLSRGQIIKLKQPKKTQKLIIYIASNHGDTEKTSINSISFKGDFVQHKNNNQASEKVRNEVTECKECSQQNFTPIIPPLKNTSIHLKRITEHKVNADHSNTHCFRWTFDSLPEFQRFIHAPVNDVTFRSDYHIIDGWVFYFEITPNGTTDRVKVDAGSTNVWLNLHKSIEGKPYVKVRFQCVCINEHMSFIGECDALLGTADCKDTTVTMAAISTTNAMRFSSFKHLEKLSFDCYVTLNPKTFQFQMGKKDTADRYEATDNATNDDPMLVAKDKIVKSQQAKPTISDIGGHRAAKHPRRPKTDDIALRLKTDEQTQQQLKRQITDYNMPCSASNNVLDCVYARALMKIVTRYDQAIDYLQHNHNLTEIIDKFIHVSNVHSDDDQFELFVNMLGPCVIKESKKECDVLNRHHQNTHTNPAYEQILDKIHCYFMHSYDVGNRLRKHEKDLIRSRTEHKRNQNDNEFENRQVKQIRDILCSKQRRCNDNINRQTNQLPTNRTLTKYKQLDMYNYGYRFCYGDAICADDPCGIHVQPKHSSLKDEMLHNTIATINIQRFPIEYQKAKLHLETSYVKQRFRAFTDHKSKLWIFHVELILSLMIYCNY